MQSKKIFGWGQTLCEKNSEIGFSFLLVKEKNLCVDKNIPTFSLICYVDQLKLEQ